jgi:hypothetical protein
MSLGWRLLIGGESLFCGFGWRRDTYCMGGSVGVK